MKKTVLRFLVSTVHPARPFFSKVKFFFDRPKIAQLFHYAAGITFIFSCLITIYAAIIRSFPVLQQIWIFPLFFASIGFLIEARDKISKILEFIWAKTLGKALFGFLTILIGCVATAQAKNLTHIMVGVDPKFFPDFINALSLILSIFLFFGLLQIFVIFLAFLKSVSVYSVGFTKSVLIESYPNFTQLLGRMLSGKRNQSQSSFFSKLQVTMFDISYICGAFSVLFILLIPFTLIDQYNSLLSSILVHTLVEMEYRRDSMCENVLPNARVAYLDRGYVSIANFYKGVYSFSIGPCKYSSITKYRK